MWWLPPVALMAICIVGMAWFQRHPDKTAKEFRDFHEAVDDLVQAVKDNLPRRRS